MNYSKIIFNPIFHIKILNHERVLLFSEDQHHLLNGNIYGDIARILKEGARDEKEIFHYLTTNNYSTSLIEEAFKRLKLKSFIIPYYENVPAHAAAFWIDVKVSPQNLRRKTVVVKNFSNSSETSLVTAFQSLNINVESEGDFFVVLVDNYINEQLAFFNAERLKDHKPWILLKASGRIFWIGPIFESNITGCWNCLISRLKENLRVEIDAFGTDNEKLNIPAKPSLPISQAMAMNLAAIEVSKWQRSLDRHRLHDSIFTFDFNSLETRLHNFKKLSLCPSCQPFKSYTLPQAPILKACSKKHIYQTGERAFSNEDTLENIKSIVSPITGIISSMRHTLINDEHVCYSVRNLPIPDYSYSDKKFRVPDAVTGKGNSRIQATVGCLAEAIERYNCTFTKQYEIRARYSDVKSRAIHPNSLLNVSESQYEKRILLNQFRDGFNKIPKQYDGSEIGWTPFYSLINKNYLYIPSSYCYLNYPVEKEIEMCPGNSNGCASGNTLEEAVFYGLLELIERDCVAIWWYNRIKRPCIDVNKFTGEILHQTIVNFRKNGREISVLDLTNDLQIPCYAAVSWNQEGKRIFLGTGAHLDPNIGIARAVSELNQTMIRSNVPTSVDLTKIPGSERDFVKWIVTENILEHPYLIPSKTTSPSYPFQASSDFLEDINKFLKIFQDMGLDVLILDMSNPDVNFYSVRVVCPGLRHFWSRLGPGRLYEVPTNLGWQMSTTEEINMNPTPYFL